MDKLQPPAQRLPAEQRFAAQLQALEQADNAPKPAGWRLSPQAVRRFILGVEGKDSGGEPIERKIFGNDVVVERSIVTLAGQRGLMLVGEPGTAKSYLSELLAAAISGNSTDTVQASAGLVEEQIRYSWNYALLLRQGPSREALVPAPLYQAMSKGRLMRFEEITRCATEVQDSLISVLSDRLLHIPELEGGEAMLLARPGFNIIATANLRDRGVNEMSSALKRRFNFETMQPLRSHQAETELIRREVNRMLAEDEIKIPLSRDVSGLLVQVFQELRGRQALGTKLEPLSSILSTAEAIDVAYSAVCEVWYMDSGEVRPRHLLRHLSGTVIKDDEEDRKRLRDYLRLVRSQRQTDGLWNDLLEGERWL